MKPITVLSYNVGHLCILEPWRHIPIVKLKKIFFQRNDLPQIKLIVEKVKPDVIFFQELTSKEDAEFLAKNLGFSFCSFSRTNHFKNQNLGTGILYNFKNSQIKTEHKTIDLHSLFLEDYIFTCIHFHPVLRRKRAKQMKELIAFVSKYPGKKHIIGGDFNLSKRQNWWVNRTDRNSYQLATKVLIDATSRIPFTHKLKYKFDYFFVSPTVKDKNIKCIHKTYKEMDHYPITVEVV